MSDVKSDGDQVFEIKITTSAWCPPDKSYKFHTRRWSGPPVEDRTANVAARVEKKLFWPFARYDWAVFSPFYDDVVDEGECPTIEAAFAASDAALKRLCNDAAKVFP